MESRAVGDSAGDDLDLSGARCVARRLLPVLVGSVVLVAIGACAVPREAVRRETAIGHPLAAARENGAVGLFGELPGPEGGGDSRERGTGAFRGAQASRRSSLPVLSMTPVAGGETGASLRASAMRLLGIRGSFDQRSFLGHLLRVNDLLPAGASSQDWKVGTSLQRAREAGVLVPVERANPGHLLFFRCDERCGPMETEGIGACVVVEVGSGGGRCIGYLQGEVRWLRFGQWSSGDPDVGRIEGVSPPLEP